ncbi:hypothetical protein OK024_05625 [Acinetobacter sp. UGAL515B_02]|nr:hypothetical protein [Acinetobacter sp. UGAL515B_02]WON81161.1 hypothetical protein OK024_05625 [Acinetobacter sp. UGAL515B_02]
MKTQDIELANGQYLDFTELPFKKISTVLLLLVQVWVNDSRNGATTQAF